MGEALLSERLKALRKSVGLTQKDFAARIGVKPNTVAVYEMGRRNLSSPAINNICKEFGVNETWLRTGEGGMFAEHTPSEELERFVESVQGGPPDSFQRRLLGVLARLSREDWDLMERMADDLLEHLQTDSLEQGGCAGRADAQGWTGGNGIPLDDAEREMLHAELDRQLDMEQKGDESSVYGDTGYNTA